MIPMRTSSIFKSRWMALIWCAGIIWFAVSVAGPDESAGNNAVAADQPTDVTGAKISDENMQAVRGLRRAQIRPQRASPPFSSSNSSTATSALADSRTTSPSMPATRPREM